MKALTISIIIAISVLGAQKTKSQQHGDSFSTSRQTKTANVVYVHASVNGFATVTGGNPSGLLVDLMAEFEQYVSNTHGISIRSKYVSVPSKGFKLYLDEVKKSSGGVFGLSNTSIKADRRRFFEFSPSFLNNISVLISNKSFPPLNNLSDIKDVFSSKNGYAVPSTTNHARMLAVKGAQFSSMNIISVKSSREIVENVARDSKGYGFVDIHYYLEYLNKGKSIKRHPVGDKAGDKFGIILPKGSDWSPVLAEFLNSGILDSPKYRQMVSKNLGKGALRMIN